MPSDLKARIRAATLKSLKARDSYTARMTAGLTRALKQAQGEVTAALRSYKSLGSLPDNKLAALKGLEKLQGEIAETMKRLRREHTLAFRRSTKESFGLGIAAGIGELADAALPFYADLTPGGIDKLATKVFQIVDTDALDFMTQYNLTLAGDVHRELADGIKRTILSGIATGKGSDDIVRDLGKVIVDKDSFRQAGTKVFSRAQYRMEMIARTEVLRAHNMGRLKFHQRAGVQKLEWMAMEDERMCEVCGGYDGKTFPIDKFPEQPAHPHCRCTNLVAWPMVICGGELAAKAAPNEPQGDACILPPHVLEGMADAESAENAVLKTTFERGTQADLQGLTMVQVKKLAKQNGVSVARTKADFLALLDKAEPGIDHSGLGGQALKAKLAAHQIGALRTKQELMGLLAQKQAALQQAKLAARQIAQLAPVPGLEGMPVAQLKEMAKAEGISLNMTKQDTIELLDKLDPGVDHTGLSGKDLIAAKKKHGIGVLKNKQQLVEALQKKAGQQMAQEAKAKEFKAAIEKQKVEIKDSVLGVQVPQKPDEYAAYLQSLKQAEQAFQAASDVPPTEIAHLAENLAIKKQVVQSQLQQMKSVDLKKMAKEAKVSHWQWGSKDDFITLFSETDEAKIAAIQAKLDAGYKAHQEKYKKGGKPKSTPQPKPPKPEPQPQAPPEATKPTKKGAEFEAVDAAWREKGRPGKFKSAGKAAVGGAHEKEFWTDEDGKRWLFKPNGRQSDDFIAHGEEAAYRIGRLIDPDAIEVRTTRLNGHTGSIQKWRTDLKDDFDFRNTLPENLTTSELEQIQREHVIDWLVANHDGHSKQFIRALDGHVYGIDKGQAFKFLGQDRLALDYHPNQVHGEQEPYYNTIFRAEKEGRVKFDPTATLRAIEEVEKVSDEDYLAILKPYGEGRFGGDQNGLKHFYDLALDRKHNLRRDFESYYTDVLGERDFRFAKLASADEKAKRLSTADEAILREAEALGWQGKTLPIDMDDIEDQNALVFSETFQGKRRTVMKFKLRPEANSRILAGLRKGDMTGAPKRIGKPLNEDDFYGDILAAVKTVNHHQQDGKYNVASIEKALKHRSALGRLTKDDDPEVRDMAMGYMAWLEEVDESHKARGRTEGDLTQYLRKSEPPRRKSDAAFTVHKGEVENTLRALEQGAIRVQDDAASNSDLFRGRRIEKGEQYTATFPDGTRVRYRPWSAQNAYAQRGEVEVMIPRGASADDVADAMERLGGWGINASAALPEHAEWMYLRKMAYVSKEDQGDAFKKVLKELDDRDASVSERVQTLRDYWQTRLGVRDITRLPGYNPQGEYQHGFLDRKLKGGYRQQYRFDLSEADLEREMKGYALHHNVTGGADLGGFIDTVLENNGAMVSTVEKLRIGIPPGGMSPEADMDSGGASYFFTRIRKLPTNGRPTTAGLYFKKQLLRRMDAVSYDHDAYGRVTDDYVHERRGSQPRDWKQFARNSSNETIFKYSVTLLDNIDTIVTGNQAERDRILKSFTRRGITVLPDGRKIENVVVAR